MKGTTYRADRTIIHYANITYAIICNINKYYSVFSQLIIQNITLCRITFYEIILSFYEIFYFSRISD